MKSGKQLLRWQGSSWSQADREATGFPEKRSVRKMRKKGISPLRGSLWRKDAGYDGWASLWCRPMGREGGVRNGCWRLWFSITLGTTIILPWSVPTRPVLTPEMISLSSHSLIRYLGSQSKIGRRVFIIRRVLFLEQLSKGEKGRLPIQSWSQPTANHSFELKSANVSNYLEKSIGIAWKKY